MSAINQTLYTLAREVYRHKSAYNVSMYMRETTKHEHIANSHFEKAVTHKHKEDAVRDAVKALGFSKKELDNMMVLIEGEEADSF